ncbi:MAG: biotin--[acetyl-CoA-carboxylase] ligase [Planctomycetota bacterium]
MFPLGLLRELKRSAGEWSLPGPGAPAGAKRAREAKELEASGLRIERHPYLGMRILPEGMPLVREELSAIHAEAGWGGEAVFRRATGSTNDDAGDLARRGAAEGTVVIAEHQTRGRGRLGRRWESRKGKDLLLSLVLRPSFSPAVAGLTVLGAVAATEGILRSCGRRMRIRWPNDVVYRRKKVAGVLVEGGKERSGRPFFVVGIGINVCGEAPMTGATTLEEACGTFVDRAAVFGGVLGALRRRYDDLAAGRLDEIERFWKERSATLGRNITIESGGRRYSGEVVDLSLREGLVLEGEKGERRHFRGEHVSVIEHDRRGAAHREGG